MLAIIARYTFATAADAAAFCEQAKTLVVLSRAEKGCTYYAFGRDNVDGSVVWVSEEWECQDDLTTHLKAAHVAAFLTKITEIKITSEVSRQYEVSSVGPVVMPTD